MILLIEDEEILRFTFKSFLSKKGMGNVNLTY
jgi:hypothetical protein